ncbi:MAG: complex I subunit 4 family protein [Vulcanimicrobiaceae bacterium]
MTILLIVLPIVAGSLLFLAPPGDKVLSKVVGCAVAAVTFFEAIFARGGGDFTVRWLSRPFTAAFHFNTDGISFWIVLLLALCTFCAVLACNVPRTRNFIALLLLLEGAMMGVFTAKDLLAFALFWDLMLLPVFFALAGWGERRDTAWRYLIYNFAGGLALLLATAAFGMAYGSTDVIGQAAHPLAGAWAPWIFAGFAFAFLVKTPVWPLHTWMPATYADTPSPMVAVVSAVQSKAGLYGFIAIALPFASASMHDASAFFIVLGSISLLYGAFAALAQTDAKRIVAYSSLSHLGLILIAIFSFNAIALQGALVYIIAHGLFSAALFLVIGYVEEREESRSLARRGGGGKANPRLAGAFTIAALAALGLPGLAGFAGEIVILTGVVQAGNIWPALVALVAIVVAAAYMLRLLQGAINGPQVADLPVRRDLTLLEGLAMAPLLAALVAIGVNPHLLTSALAMVTK